MKQAYFSRSERKQFWLRRIIITLIILALIFVATVLLGILLKNRSDYLQTIIENTAEPTPEPHVILNNGNDVDELHLNSGTITLTNETTIEEAQRAVSALPFLGFDSLALQLTDNQGLLLYDSPALASVARQSYGGFSFELLTAVASKAKALGLRTTAILSVGHFFDSEINEEALLSMDAMLVRELESIGFSEVLLIDYPFTDEISDDSFRLLRTYITTIRSNTSTIDIGVGFSASVYLDQNSTQNINTLSLYADFLALDVRSGHYNSETDFSLLTSVYSLHNLRTIIQKSDEQAADLRQALSAAGCNNYQEV